MLEQVFQSTPSAWRVTDYFLGDVVAVINISIHTLRVEGDVKLHLVEPVFRISIHTLRVEGDFGDVHRVNGFVDFNPHPPRGG